LFGGRSHSVRQTRRLAHAGYDAVGRMPLVTRDPGFEAVAGAYGSISFLKRPYALRQISDR
jgi:hypothetical protein